METKIVLQRHTKSGRISAGARFALIARAEFGPVVTCRVKETNDVLGNLHFYTPTFSMSVVATVLCSLSILYSSLGHQHELLLTFMPLFTSLHNISKFLANFFYITLSFHLASGKPCTQWKLQRPAEGCRVGDFHQVEFAQNKRELRCPSIPVCVRAGSLRHELIFVTTVAGHALQLTHVHASISAQPRD